MAIFQVLCRAVLPNINGIDRDAATNSFVVQGAGDTVLAVAAVAAEVVPSFYNSKPANPRFGSPIASFLSGSISRAADACLVQAYDITGHLDGSNHGSPVYVADFTLNAESQDDDVPAQVSATLALRGEGWATAPVEAGVTRPKSRRAGRVRVGPLNALGIGTVESSGRLTTSLRNALLDAGQVFNETLELAEGGIDWRVWSRENAATYDVESMRVNDKPTTTRTRGLDPTVAQTYVL